MSHSLARKIMSPTWVGGPSPPLLLSRSHPKRALCALLKQISHAGDLSLLPFSVSGLRTPSPGRGFNCPVFQVLNSTYTLVWAFYVSVTLGVLLAVLIWALQYCCYPYYKDEEKGTAK